MGPDVGLPTLRAMIPWAGRAPLRRKLRSYRKEHRRRRRARLFRLTWHQAGSVWAVDLADPPSFVDGVGRVVLAVRDLASGHMVAWAPLERGSGKAVADELARLFRRHGAPLVLKSDNGSCFVSAHVRMLLARSGVVHLRSPRAWPQYNGACEGGIGLMRALTDVAAAGYGAADCWTLEALIEARERANRMPRYRGRRLVAPQLEWAKRSRVTASQRRRFSVELRRHQAEHLVQGPGATAPRRRRRVIQAALVNLGYLSIESGWFRARTQWHSPPPSRS